MRPKQNCSTRSQSRILTVLPPELRAELLEFFGHPDAPYATKRTPREWMKVQTELEELRKPAFQR